MTGSSDTARAGRWHSENMRTSKYVILGGGMVAGYAAKQMVELGLGPDQLTIVSSDSALPYERPPLSKSFLAGKDTEESILINPQQYYTDRGIDVKLRCEVDGIDPNSQKLFLRSGGELGFDKLIIATGARPRQLDIPGSRLPHVHYLRSMDDSRRIREQ